MAEIRAPDAATLEAVYNLNKHAKKYARLAEENYRGHKKATAHANSLRKKALYGTKSRTINRFLLDGTDALVDVERHEINGDPFLCLRFEDEHGDQWSYHQPEEEVFTSRFPDDLVIIERDPDDFTEFKSGEEKERSDRPLKACLLHLEACGINANDYLDKTHVSYGSRRFFVGWSYLGDGGKTLS